MSKDLRTPKYLREFVLSRCLGCTVRVEAIAREWTKQQRGPMPGLGTQELPDYAKGAASDFKQVRRAVLDLVELEEATIPHEGFVRSAIETTESKGV